ncbi:MAG: hypothetical protein NT069_28255 [Planctomycetota bacterium]|nr:hypothetical protein [Planctomycetota bacterium]
MVNHRRNLGEIERVLKDLQVLVAAHKPPAEGEGPPPADAPATAFDHPVSLSGATPERIQAALQFRVSPKFESTSLLDAVDWIADQIGIPILIDQKAVEDANLTADVNEKSVVMSLTDVSAGTLLSLLFEGKDLKYTVSHGVLQITTTAVVEDEDRLTVRVYDVQPFLSRGDDRNAEIVQLLESIPTLVDPSSWETVGGSATYRLLQRTTNC